MKKIKLTQGKFALVDNEDFEYLNQFNWSAYKPKNSYIFYACRNIITINKHSSMQMHREILKLSFNDRLIIDHKDRNGLNNQKHNLRITNHSINAHNSKIQSNNTSGYRGVYYHKQRNKWVTRAVIFGVPVYCGIYNDVIEAAKMYDKVIIENYGTTNIFLNFPLSK